MDERQTAPSTPPFELSQLKQVLHLQRAEKLTFASLGLLIGAMAVRRRPIVAGAVMLFSSLVLYRESAGACLIRCDTDMDANNSSSNGVAGRSQVKKKQPENEPPKKATPQVELPLRVSEQPRAVEQNKNANTSVIPEPKSPRPENQQIDEASEESFPASDPPSYSGGTATPHTQSPKQ